MSDNLSTFPIREESGHVEHQNIAVFKLLASPKIYSVGVYSA